MVTPESAGKNTTPSPESAAVQSEIENNLEKLSTLCGSSPCEAEILATDTLTMSQKLGNPSLVGSSLCLLARAVSLLRDSQEAIGFASRAVEILRPLKTGKCWQQR